MTATTRILETFRRATGSEFVRAVATLSSGQGLAAFIPILAAPVLGRLYLPADYGPLSTYMAVGQVLATMAPLQLQHAVFAEADERRAEQVVRLCTRVSLGAALIGAVIGGWLFVTMKSQLGYEEARGWMLLLPLTTLMSGASAGILALANRRGHYGALANRAIYQAVAVTGTTVALGFLGWGVHGLFVGYILGNAVMMVLNLLLLQKIAPHLSRLHGGTALALLRRHRRFAIYTLPSELFSSSAQTLPVFALASLGSAAALGSFARANSLVSVPLNLVGSAVGQVFRQRASAHFHVTGDCRRIYVQTALALLAIGAGPTALLMLFGPELFRLVLGPNWGEAGQMAALLAPMLLLRLISVPVTNVFFFVGAQRLDFLLSMLTNVAVAASVLAPLSLGAGAQTIVLCFSLSFSLTYTLYLLVGWHISKRQESVRDHTTQTYRPLDDA